MLLEVRESDQIIHVQANQLSQYENHQMCERETANEEEEVEEKQMRLRDEKRDHLFQTLITLLPCSSVSPSP